MLGPMTALDEALADLPRRFPGPGGAATVLHNGEIVERHSWGWADAERRIPFTPQTLFRICSITKQFTCALALDAFPDLSTIDSDVRFYLPNLAAEIPSAARLAHNQSGLRDYWALAMLHGAPTESAFGDLEAAHIVRSTRTLQFAPGSRYSYCNQNFRILSDILQARAGRSFAELLRTRIFEPTSMATALLAADTTALPDGATGYEGTQAGGFRPAKNRIIWTGDAGIAASLDDMIAWERYIDRTRNDAKGFYNRLSAPVAFPDGTHAQYGFGLGRRTLFGRAVTAHGGALRGWRSHRLHLAGDRISVVVLFNHMADAQSAAHLLLAAILGETPEQVVNDAPIPPIAGAYLEPETGLSVRIQPGPPGKLLLHYDRFPEILALNQDGTAGAADHVLLRREGEALWMDRAADHQSTRLTPCAPPSRLDIAGRYRCAELDAHLTITDAGNVLYGAFSGFLGQGRMELLDAVAVDLWTLPCPRALDHTPPGDWTLAVHREADGPPAAITVGCWLARNLRYEREPGSHH